ncbi:hypothetical protein BCR32DRAFT_295783 [Anaeromyces robustus]|uniref:Uncharacterized protein n=1 Tax=Anaeromyces robustus TaxID=1754192 RepID=A0A1Y1WUG4_9FUNG|nr:hypothetical protein BCR32DRAFT_295783 [Anaeromyces robustus]|eukprot:ORX77190.1 hypothetical protein BCR32DRAFT_295783 [Anaeromyces robustus]
MTLNTNKHEENAETKKEQTVDLNNLKNSENKMEEENSNNKETNNENNENNNTDSETDAKPEPTQKKDSSVKKNTCEECQKNKKNLVNALKHIKTLQGNSTKLLEFYEKIKKEKNVLEENDKKYKVEVTSLHEKIKLQEVEKQKLNELLLKSQNEISELKKKSNYTQISMSATNEEIKEENLKLKENIENLENKYKLSQKEIEKYKIDFSNYRDQVKNQQRINKDKINIYEKELKDFREIKADYEKELKKNKVLNEKIIQLENTINELKTNEMKKKINEKDDNNINNTNNTNNNKNNNNSNNSNNNNGNDDVINSNYKEMEIKLWKLNNTVTELEQKRMQMELEKNLLFQENLRLSEKIKKMTNLQINNLVDKEKDNNNNSNKDLKNDTSLSSSSLSSNNSNSSISTSFDSHHHQQQQQQKLKEKDKIIEEEKKKYEKTKNELNEKIDQINLYKRLIEKKTKEIRNLNKDITNLEEKYSNLKDKNSKLEDEFDSKLEKIENKYHDEIESFKYTLKHKEILHQKEKLSLFGIITRQQVEIDDFKNSNNNIMKDEDMDISPPLSIYETKESSYQHHYDSLNDRTKFKVNKRINDEREDDRVSKFKKIKHDESNQKQQQHHQDSNKDKEKEKLKNKDKDKEKEKEKEKEKLNHKKKKEDSNTQMINDNDLSDTLFDDTDDNIEISSSKKFDVESSNGRGDEDVESMLSNSPKKELILNEELINNNQSINREISSQDKKNTTPISPNQKKRLKAIISIKKRISNKKYIDLILENKEKNNILEIILNKSVDITDLKHRIPVFEQFSENVNTVMQCLKQHYHKYTSTSSMISPPQMFVPQMWEKRDSSEIPNTTNSNTSNTSNSLSSKKLSKDKDNNNEKREESSYDQSYGNNEFIIRLPYYLPYPEKQALFLIWMLYQYSGKKFIDTILSSLSNDIVLIKHSTKDYPYLCCITRAFILLCKNLNDYERARVFCFDLLRESSHGSEIMIHIFANIAKAWPILLNYSSLLEPISRTSPPSVAAAMDEKIKSFEIFSDESHTILNRKDSTSSNLSTSSSSSSLSSSSSTSSSSSSSSNKEKEKDLKNEGEQQQEDQEQEQEQDKNVKKEIVRNEGTENPEDYKIRRKVKMVVRLFYQSFEVIICWLYLNMCMERKIDLNHVSVKYLYNIFIKEWKWKQPESTTADLASFIQKLLNLLEDKEIIECIKNIDLINLPSSPPPLTSSQRQKEVFASIIRIHLLKSFELICSCFEWSYCHNYVIKVHLWKKLDSDISGYIIELIGKISRSKLTMITEAREGLDTWRSNFSQALSAEQTPLYVQISLVKSIFDIFQGQVEELKPVILWYNKLSKETKKLISPPLLYEIETYKKQYEKELKSLNL